MSEVFIGRYRVIEELGRGGMGIVYRAEDPALDRPVAIKVLPPKKMSSQKAIKRFLREARVCARLDHSNIIKIHDIGEQEGIYHIVMELVEGRSLRDLIEERDRIGQIDIDHMVDLFLQACEALAYAHSKKVIHRDIKPDNVMLSSDGRVKVMDFGLAVLEDRHSLTEMGQVMGTVAYFSPEQAKGDPADARSDLYSLGAVFFEMLTNQLVFQAKNPAEMITKQLTSPPPNPKIYNPGIPPVLSNLVLRLLKKHPDERPQSAEDVIEVVNQWLDSKKLGARGISQVNLPPAPNLEDLNPPDPRVVDRMARDFETGGFVPQTLADEEKERDAGYSRQVSPRRSSGPARREPDTPAGGSFARDYAPAGGSFDIPSPREPEPDYHLESRRKPPQDFDKTYQEVTRIPVPESPRSRKPPEVNPTANPSPVASPDWIEETGKGEWNRYQHVVDKIKRDEVAREQAGTSETPLSCPRCGAENSPGRRYCHECGNLITRDQFLSQKQGMAHHERGKELLRENNLSEAAQEFREAVKKHPRLTEAHMSLGRVLGDLGEYKDARAAYREAARQMPDNASPHVLIADLYRLENRRDDAIYEYREAAKLAPSDISIRNQLALLFSQKGDLDRAIDEYQRILVVDPENLEAHRQLGYMFMAKERLDEAIREFEWVLTVDPQDEQIRNVLRTLYIKNGRLRNAEQTFHTMLEENPEDSKAMTALAEIYATQNRVDLALDQLNRAIRKDESNVDARKKLADIYLHHSRPDLAVSELEKAARFRPEDPDLHRNLGNIYLQNKKLDKALLHFEKTISLAPASAEMHHKLARLYTTKDYSELSINEYKKAVKLEPYNPQYREDLSMALYTQRRYDDAIKEMKKAATLDGTNVEYRKALGIMFEENNQLDEAEKQFKRVIQDNPQDPMAQGMLGRIYSKRGLLSMAVMQYKKALEANPNSHLFHVYLGKALAGQGRQEEAVQAFQRAIELAPGGDAARGSRILGKAYADLGRVYLEQGDLSKAMDVLRSAEENNPNDPTIMHYLGILYADRTNFEKAFHYLSMAMRMDPQNTEIMRDMASVYRERGDLTLALSMIKKAMMSGEENLDSHEILARTLADMGRYNEAQSTLSGALAQFSGEGDYIYWLKGVLAAKQKDWESAVRYYSRAVEQNPGEWTYLRDYSRALEGAGEYAKAVEQLQQARNLVTDKDVVQSLDREIKKLEKATTGRKSLFGG